MPKRRVVIDDLDNYPGTVDNAPTPTEPARLLRQSPHSTDYREIRASFDEEGVPKDVTDPAAIAEAGEESGYTNRQGQALPNEPEAISKEEQERQTRASREKRERVVMSPLYAIDADLEKLEKSGNYKPGKVRFIRKLLNQLGEDAMRTAVDE
jgi:hypothetical protein